MVKFKDLAKAIVDAWQTDNQDIVNAIGPAIEPQEGCIDCGSEEGSGVDLIMSGPDGDSTITGTLGAGTNSSFPKDELNQFANVKDDKKDKKTE